MIKSRAIAYVDGLNLHGGICDIYRRDLLWIDLFKLIKWKISSDFNEDIDIELVAIKYFNTQPKSDQDKIDRHKQWIKLLQNFSEKFEIISGKFKKPLRRCKKCGRLYRQWEEKRTDVNIACHLLFDYFDNKFDIAYIFSGDSDFVPAIQLLRERSNKIEIVAMFPPERYEHDIVNVCNRSQSITIPELERFVLPEAFTFNGIEFIKPPSWRKCR